MISRLFCLLFITALFQVKEQSFSFQACGIAGKAAVSPDNPVTRNQNQDWVRIVGQANCPGSIFVAGHFRQLLVTSGLRIRNLLELTPDILLEAGAFRRKGQVKFLSLAGKVFLQLPHAGLNQVAGWVIWDNPVSRDFRQQAVLDMLTMANNGLVHDIFKDLDQAESYVHYTGLDKMICHEGLNFCQKIAEAGEDGYFVDYELSLACAGFLTELSRHYHARVRLDSSRFPSSNVHYTNPMTRSGMIMNYLVANIQDVTLEKMAIHFGYQPKYLSRLIRQLFDQTFSQLKTETRVSISKSLLELTTKSIEEISEIVGYPSISSYYRAFKEATGMTPSEYRKMRREG